MASKLGYRKVGDKVPFNGSSTHFGDFDF